MQMLLFRRTALKLHLGRLKNKINPTDPSVLVSVKTVSLEDIPSKTLLEVQAKHFALQRCGTGQE